MWCVVVVVVVLGEGGGGVLALNPLKSVGYGKKILHVGQRDKINHNALET